MPSIVQIKGATKTANLNSPIYGLVVVNYDGSRIGTVPATKQQSENLDQSSKDLKQENQE